MQGIDPCSKSANDPQLPDDVGKRYGSFLIQKLPVEFRA
jgi:hypothetical protein